MGDIAATPIYAGDFPLPDLSGYQPGDFPTYSPIYVPDTSSGAGGVYGSGLTDPYQGIGAVVYQPDPTPKSSGTSWATLVELGLVAVALIAAAQILRAL